MVEKIKAKCKTCGGTGIVKYRAYAIEQGPASAEHFTKPCPDCKGEVSDG